MRNIIGIYSENKVDRRKAAWLLAKTIEEYRKGVDFQEFAGKFHQWYNSPTSIGSTHHVTIESFGETILDQIRLFNPYLQSLNLHDPEIKDHLYVNLGTMELFQEDSIPGQFIFSLTDELISKIENDELGISSVYLTVGDYILYFADHIMKKYFGSNVWLNSIRATNRLVNSSGIRIYWDVKTQPEIDYIRNEGGLLLQLDGGKDKCRYHKVRNFHADATLSLMEDPGSYWNLAQIILN